VIEVVCFALLFAGSWVTVPWRDGRYLHYVFSFVAFEAFLAFGPSAVWLAIGAGGAGVVAQISWHRLARRARAGSFAIALSLGVTTVANSVAMLAASAIGRAMHAEYPVPFFSAASFWRFTLLLNCLFVTSALVKEGLLRGLMRELRRGPPPGVESGAAVYGVGAVVGAPLHYVAHPLYVHGLVLPWVGAMLWSFLLNAVIRRELERDRRARALMRELASKERLSAVGEVTARIVHQTRHQLGIIGISAHRIGKRVAALSGDDARIVQEELAKLDEVQRELAAMLTRNLRHGADASHVAPPLSYADLIAGVAQRLAGVAETRGVRLELGTLACLAGDRPARADHVAQGFFNVLENALSAARTVVRVEAEVRRGERVVLVQDDGPGLDPAVLDRATEPFFTTKPEGTGMGLAIARAAFEEEGAALRVANRPEGGCRVEVALPAEEMLRPLAT
jgi:signal transduction histidine kinase